MIQATQRNRFTYFLSEGTKILALIPIFCVQRLLKGNFDLRTCTRRTSIVRTLTPASDHERHLDDIRLGRQGRGSSMNESPIAPAVLLEHTDFPHLTIVE
ncbi:unnamed protein product [Peronospora belbahrii]|uniref:Uncharacterized protein n=1 Tax=Peronospora belbahrii TaxID=622444 RepID=A0AAU9L2R9_9STRA|nr:unnamed protein product [Peronospora belbahrii]CAH0513637.1 unnamed protein product [Peronospora belbahrii]